MTDRTWSRAKPVLAVALATAATAGCATHGAPSFVFFGAYFPAWMLVAGIGILAAVGARVVMVATGHSRTMPFQLLTCSAVGLTAAILCWLIGFAR